MLHIDRRSSIDRPRMTGPVNSMARYSAPSTPIWPMVCRMRSLPATHRPRVPLKTNRIALGHPQPDLADGHGGRQVGRPDARGEGPQRPVGARVAVGPDDEVAGPDDALLRQEGVLDAHLAHLPVMLEALLVGEVAQHLRLLGAGDVLVGREVVGHQGHAVLVPDLADAGRPELLDGDGRGDIVAEGDIDARKDEVARLDARPPRVGGDDLFGDRHRHGKSRSVFSVLHGANYSDLHPAANGFCQGLAQSN